MKKQILKISFITIICILLAIRAYFIFQNILYRNVTKIDIVTNNGQAKDITINNNKQIFSFIRAITSAHKLGGMIIINKTVEDAADKITIYYKNKKSISIILLMGGAGDKSIYYYDKDKITGYSLSAKESNKIREIINNLK